MIDVVTTNEAIWLTKTEESRSISHRPTLLIFIYHERHNNVFIFIYHPHSSYRKKLWFEIGRPTTLLDHSWTSCLHHRRFVTCRERNSLQGANTLTDSVIVGLSGLFCRMNLCSSNFHRTRRGWRRVRRLSRVSQAGRPTDRPTEGPPDTDSGGTSLRYSHFFPSTWPAVHVQHARVFFRHKNCRLIVSDASAHPSVCLSVCPSVEHERSIESPTFRPFET